MMGVKLNPEGLTRPRRIDWEGVNYVAPLRLTGKV